MVKDIKSYILNKLFFPKTIVIDRPGIIISKTTKWYGKTSSQKRIIWDFEDIFVSHQLEAIKRLGKKKASDLYYKIGKDVGTKYVLLAGARKKTNKFFLKPAIEFICYTLNASGISISKNICFDSKTKSISLTGEDSIICRKTKDASVYAGLFSGIFSSLIKENIEGEALCKDCPNYCKIMLKPETKARYLPDYKKLKPAKSTTILKVTDRYTRYPNSYSFNDLIRFKKVSIDVHGKFYLNKLGILPSDLAFLELVIDNFKKIEAIDIFKKGVVRASKKIANQLLSNLEKNNKKEKLDFFISLLSAFGWGIMHYTIRKKTVVFHVRYAPFTRHNFLYPSLVILGFLKSIYNQSIKIEDIDYKIKEQLITIYFKHKSH